MSAGAGRVDSHFHIEQDGEVTVVRIDRPPANALDADLQSEGVAVLSKLRAAEPAAVVVTGRDGFFSAGVDLKLAPDLDAAAQRATVDSMNRLFGALYSFPRPVVCAVNGHAIAGGLVLALCGDYRVAADRGRLGLTEVRAGIPLPAVAMAVVRAELSPRAARLLALGVDLIEPREALELGVVDEVVEPAAVMERALEVARGLAALPPRTFARVKQDLRAPAIEEIERIVEQGADPALTAWLSDETRTAAAAILARAAGAQKTGDSV